MGAETAVNAPGSDVGDADTTAPSEPQPVDTILTEEAYYYYSDDYWTGDPKYPVCTSFEDWQFPHDRFLELAEWKNVFDLDVIEDRQECGGAPPSLVSVSADKRDFTCRVTDCRDYHQGAHMVHKRYGTWVSKNLSTLQQSACGGKGNSSINRRGETPLVNMIVLQGNRLRNCFLPQALYSSLQAHTCT